MKLATRVGLNKTIVYKQIDVQNRGYSKKLNSLYFYIPYLL